MVSALHAAKEHGVALAHLWRRNSPVGCSVLFEDEITGSRSCDFESLFEPIPDFPSFYSSGESIRLLYEEGSTLYHRSLNIIEEVPHPCVAFQHHGHLNESHFAGVDALLVLRSLSFPIRPAEKVSLYRRYFRPLGIYREILETRDNLLAGRWLCVHLRNKVRSAFGIREWDMEELVEKATQLTAAIQFERIIVFSDSDELRQE